MKKVTFIHAADLHLDSPMVGLKHLPREILKRLQESTFTSLIHIIDAAIFHKVDFVLFAGDLFDGENRSIRAQTRFRKQLERLHENNIPAYIIHGNHDHLGGKWAQFSYPENTYIFPAEFTLKTFTKQDATTVSIYGFSYPKRHVTERRIDEYIRTEGADFHIALLHGNIEGNREHSAYAPFTLGDLLKKRFDYWALGHVHNRTHLAEEPPVIYPGNTQGRHKNECGEKGCYLVTLSEAKANLEFIPTADCLWESLEVDGSQAVTVSELYHLCREKINEIRREGKGILLSLRLKNVSLKDSEKEHFSVDELREVLQDEEKDDVSSFVWPIDLIVHESNQWTREQLMAESDFYQELFSAVDLFDLSGECLESLYQNPAVRKFISLPSAQDKSALVKEAEELLIELLRTE